ncbi:MAG: hypothetical protein HY063_13680 [Bacteroidetes bacterium]|nr:hypothetical protein [Bacteroidota bacterium]
MKAIKDTREILAETEDGKITVGEKLSLEQSKKILNRNGNNYTDEQIIIIRDFIYTMATIQYLFITEQYIKNKSLTKNQNQNEKECIPLHQSEHRRAS